MKRLLSAIAIALGLSAAAVWAAPSSGPSRVALVIGNSDYQHAAHLPNPQKDAEAIAAAFQKAGFDTVTTAYNVSNLDFKRAVRQFERTAANSDIAVIYYAGHGIELHGTNFLVPVDAILANDEDAEDEAIPLDRLVQSIDGAKRLRVVILDACRDNPFKAGMKVHTVDPGKGKQRSLDTTPGPAPAGNTRGIITRGIAPDPAGGLGAIVPTDINTLIAYAAKAGSTAEDGTGEHSPFATALMDNLFVAGLDIRLAFGRVRDEVLKATENRQEPFVYGSLGGGNVSLVPGAAEPQKPAQAEADDPGVKVDYGLVEKIGTVGAWQVFLTQHPNGFYADLARQQIASLESVKRAPSAMPSDEQAAWNKIKDSTNAADFRDFLKKYPSSPFAVVADVRADAIEQQARQKEREAQMQREEEALRAQLEEAKRQAAQAAQQQAEQDAALAKAQQEAKAAEDARQQADRDAKAKADEAARQKQLADAALAEQQVAAAAAKQKADQEAAVAAQQKASQDAAAAKKQAEQQAAEAARKKAEQDAALAKLQQEAAAAEQARQQAEQARQQAEQAAAAKAQEAAKQAALAEAARKQEVACNDEQSRLNTLQTQGSKARDDLKQLSASLTCERLRPLVVAALEKANVNSSEQVRTAQQQLARLGCYFDTADGMLNDSTRAAVALYQHSRGKTAGSDIQVTDAFVNELKGQSARVCSLICPSGKVAKGDQCIVAEQQPMAPAKKTAAEKGKPAAPARPAVKEAASGHAGAIGVGF